MSQAHISLESVVVQSPEMLMGEVDGDTIMLSMETSKYYGFEAVGGRIWEILTQPQPVRRVCDALAREYDVERPTCEAEVVAFVQRLLDESLVQVRGV